MRSYLVSSNPSKLNFLICLVIPCKSCFESLAINNNIVVKGVQKLSSTFFGQSISMIHRVESSSKKIDRNLPVLLSFKYFSLLRLLLIIPHNIDLRQKLSVTLCLCISLEIFLQNRVVSFPRMSDSQQPETKLEIKYL